MKHLKFVEFYDVRAAEAALRALNRVEISGKQIKLEPGHPRFARWWLYPLLFSILLF
jgi:RNA recognition motif-containing protein